MRARLNAGGPAERIETDACRRKDGSLVDVLITASPATDVEERVVGLSVIAQDITERRAAQRALEASGRQAGRGAADRPSRQLRVRSRHRRDDLVGGALPDPRARPGAAADAASCSSRWSTPTTGWRWAGPGWTASRAGDPVRSRLPHRPGRSGESLRSTPAPSPRSAGDGTVVRLAGTLMDDTDRLDGRAGAAGGRDPVRDRLRAGGDRGGHPRSRRRSRPGQRRRVRHPRAAGGASWSGGVGREYIHPDELPLGQAVLRPVAGRPRHLRRRAALPAARRQRRVGVGARDAGARRGGRARSTSSPSSRTSPSASGWSDELAHQALHDSLTGLPNRALLTDRLVHGPGRVAAARLAARRDVPRHRPLQGGQRLAGPRRRRRAAATGGRPHRRRRSGPATPWPGSAATSSSSSATTSRHWRPTQIAERVLDGAEPSRARSAAQEMHRHGQPRHRRRRRRRDAREPAAGRRRRHVPGQGAGPGPRRAVRRGAAVQGRAHGWPRRRRCAGRSSAASSPSTTSRSSTSRPARWSAPRRWCAGSTRIAAWSAPTSSSPSPRRPGLIVPDRRLGARAGLPAAGRNGSDGPTPATVGGRQPLGPPDARRPTSPS